MKRIPRLVWTLGLVSLFTDMGSEIVHSLMPLLLTGVLGATPLILGLIEGAAEALVLFMKVFSGYISDAVGRRKPLILAGYGLSACVKPLFPLADSVGVIASARLLDRFGKGIRGAPRDALVADVTPPEIRGAAFGLRQTLDTVGAFAGPLVAVGLLWWLENDVRAVLWFAIVPGAVAVALLLRLREPETAAAARGPRLPLDRQGLATLGPAFWHVACLGAAISLARFSEAFLVLKATDVGLPVTTVPLVLVVFSATYMLAAYPAGVLSDRLTRSHLLAAGMTVLLLGDVILASANGFFGLFAGIGLWGLHFGLTQGVLASLVADVAPSAHRGSAFGMFNLTSGVALLIASTLAGALWTFAGSPWAFGVGAGLAAFAAVLCMVLRPPQHQARAGAANRL
jgi:MFS family permease